MAVATKAKEMLKDVNEALDLVLKSEVSIDMIQSMDDDSMKIFSKYMELVGSMEDFYVEAAEELDRIEHKLDELLELQRKEKES